MDHFDPTSTAEKLAAEHGVGDTTERKRLMEATGAARKYQVLKMTT